MVCIVPVVLVLVLRTCVVLVSTASYMGLINYFRHLAWVGIRDGRDGRETMGCGMLGMS